MTRGGLVMRGGTNEEGWRVRRGRTSDEGRDE